MIKRESDSQVEVSPKGWQTMRIASRKKVWALTLVCLAAVVLFYPLETTVVPQWNILVVDDLGKPVSHVPLRETWKHYSIESHGHEQELSTNDDGYVTFPQRTAKANLLVRIVRTTVNKIHPHGSTGPAASIYVLAPYSPASPEPSYSPGQPLVNQIVIRRTSTRS